MPSNHVPAGQRPADVQQQVISRHIDQLKDAPLATRAMTIALPEATIKKVFPSLDAKTRTIDLGEVLRTIQQYMGGTEFYASGNPTLNRLAIQSQVQQIMDTVKQDAKQ